MEDRVPRTPEDFEQYWRKSPEFAALQAEIEEYERDYLVEHQGESIARLRQQKNDMQSKHSRPKSPYIINIATQVRICTKRAYQRIWNDISATATQAFSHVIVALVVGSVFYGTPNATAGFFSKGSVLFLAVLINALTAISEASTPARVTLEHPASCYLLTSLLPSIDLLAVRPAPDCRKTRLVRLLPSRCRGYSRIGQ